MRGEEEGRAGDKTAHEKMWEGNRERGEIFGEGGGGGLNEDGERRWPRIVKEEIERE